MYHINEQGRRVREVPIKVRPILYCFKVNHSSVVIKDKKLTPDDGGSKDVKGKKFLKGGNVV